MKVGLSYLLMSVALFGAASETRAACISHSVNKSNYEWTIAGDAGPHSDQVIAPNTVADIAWGPTNRIAVGGNIPAHPYTHQFQIQVSGACVVIVKQGSAGQVTINSPANGGITTCAGGC